MSGKAWPAPGKLNLFLHITGRRADGYHLLQTVFQFINHCDWLYFTPRTDGVIQCLSTPNHNVASEHDLTVRAARLLQNYCGATPRDGRSLYGDGPRHHHPASSRDGQVPRAQDALEWPSRRTNRTLRLRSSLCGVDIHLDKRLPMGGGLGGGSSDAATTLVALNQIWGLHLPLEQLAELGLQLGADVPVFIHGQAAWAEGVGEKLTPIILPEPWYVVIVPPCHVSTREIFSAPELTRDAPSFTIEGFLSGLGSAGGVSNVCEPVACQRYPLVAEALAWLRKQIAMIDLVGIDPGAVPVSGARMTGTGACVFAAFADESSARQVVQRLHCEYTESMQGFVAQGMNRSPLHDE